MSLRSLWELIRSPYDLTYLSRDVHATRRGVVELLSRTDRLKEIIMTAAAGFAAQLDAVTNDIADRLDGLTAEDSDLKAQLAAALADQDQATRDAVNAALDSAFAGLQPQVDRLRALGTPEGEVSVDPAPAETSTGNAGDVDVTTNQADTTSSAGTFTPGDATA